MNPVAVGMSDYPHPAGAAELVDGVLTLTLGGGAGHAARLETAQRDSDVRVVLLRSSAKGGAVGLLPRLQALPQPVIAMVQGACDLAMAALLPACDIVFIAYEARIDTADSLKLDGIAAEVGGIATRSFPAAELEDVTTKLAKEMAAKDDLALRFTKATLRKLAGMDLQAALAYNTAKAAELKALQVGRPSARATAIESFLAGKSKPGLGN